MLGNTTPKERLGYVGITTLLVSFLCYLGAQRTQASHPPLVIKEQSPARDFSKPKSAESERPSSEILVHIVGAVKHPGVYTLKSNQHLIDAVHAAGGFVNADEQRPNLASKLTDGTQYLIPFKRASSAGPMEETAPLAIESLPEAARASRVSGGGRSKKAPDTPLDLNSATADQLQTIPGIGPSTAERILSYRTEHGSFKSVDELTSVGGIGQKKLEKMRLWLHV